MIKNNTKNKEKKEEIKKLFKIIDDKKFLRFAKSYATKDEALAAYYYFPKKPTIGVQTDVFSNDMQLTLF